MASAMNLCDMDYDSAEDRELFTLFTYLHDEERDYATSVTDASMTSESASPWPSEHTRATTMDPSEVTSNTPSYDQDDMMHENGASTNNRVSPSRARAQQSGIDSALLIPVLSDKHKERTVVEPPSTLPPSGGLVAQANPSQLPGHRTLAAQPASITSWSHGSPPQTEVPQDKPPRTRTVMDPGKTKKVRDAKACQRCSILKVSCDDEDLCGRCRDWAPNHQARMCIRDHLDTILRSGRGSVLDGGRWTSERCHQLASFNGGPRLGQPIRITVYFTPSDRQGLEIPVAQHADKNFRIVPGCSAFEAEILKWADGDLEKASLGGFQRSIQVFLYLYSQRNCTEKKTLVDNAVRISSMWRLISANELWFTQAGRHERQRLPDSIATQLKYFGGGKLFSAEQKVIDEICLINKNAFGKGKTETAAVWASLWSVIMVYRQAVQIAAMNAVTFKDGFQQVTGRLLEALVGALCGHFRTKKTLCTMDDMDQSSFQGDVAVHNAYEQSRRDRYGFYNEIKLRKCDGDVLIDTYLVKNEQEVMSRKSPKGARQNAFELQMVVL